MSSFDHTKLDVYRVALEFIELVEQLVSELPKGRADLVDQLRRAATSIVLNIAEGAGEFSPKDKARFYRMAKRSATECAAALDVLHRVGLIESPRPGHQLLLRIVPMLVRMARKLEARSGSGSGSHAGSEQDETNAPRFSTSC